MSLLDCKIGGRLRSRSLTKGTYLLLVSAWPAPALEFYYLPGMSLLTPALGYGRQTASAPALQPESDGDVTQWGKKEKKKKKKKERERRRGERSITSIAELPSSSLINCKLVGVRSSLLKMENCRAFQSLCVKSNCPGLDTCSPSLLYFQVCRLLCGIEPAQLGNNCRQLDLGACLQSSQSCPAACEGPVLRGEAE